MINHNVSLSGFLENASVPIHWVNAQGVIVWVNQAELDLLGYSETEYIGVPIASFYSDAEVAAEVLLRLSNQENLHNHPAKLKCKDGSIKYVVINSNGFRNNAELLYACFSTDVSGIIDQEQGNAKLLLQEKSARLAAIVESTEDAIISKTMDGIITSWNKAAERIFGFKSEEMINKPIVTFIPDDRLDEEQLILNRLRAGDRVEHFETKRLTKSGSLIDVSLTISPVRNLKGDIIGFSKIARNITEQKQQEQRKNDFIALVSHELRTPLTSINSFVQLLLSKSKKIEDSFIINVLGRTERQVKKMIKMVEDFLDLARLEDGKIQIKKEIFYLPALIEEIVADAVFLSALHQVEIRDEVLVYVNADRDKIGHVLINLLTNAVKYSPMGGKVTVGSQRQEGKALIYIQDEGVGIDPIDQKRLFERFFRVKDNELIKSVSGFGIGLYLASEILKDHNSCMQVKSEVGEGAIFYFTLDVLDGDSSLN